MGLGLATVLPAEIMRGVRFVEDFRDKTSMLRNGWTLVGDPPVDDGITLNGTTQHATKTLAGELMNAKLAIEIEFYPDFAPNEAVQRYFFTTNGSSYRLIHLVGGDLRLDLGGGFIAQIAEATYAPHWLVGQRNVFTISSVTGSTNVWLNGNNILLNDASPWTPLLQTTLYVGGDGAGNNFDGRITDFRIGHYLAIEQEHIDRWNRTTWNWENNLLCNLQLRTGDLDMVNVQTLDSSGYENHAQLGDGVTPATYMTQGRGRMEGNGAQYLVVPADASLPAGTYTVLLTCQVVVDTTGDFVWDARGGGGSGYLFIWDGGGNTWTFTSGSLFIDGAGPYANNTQVADEGVHTVVLQGITLDIATMLHIFTQETVNNFASGTLFDFKIAPGTLTQTQIMDYHISQKAVIGAQI